MSAAEHLANDPTSELWGEHRSRYRFAARFAAGQRIHSARVGRPGHQWLEDVLECERHREARFHHGSEGRPRNVRYRGLS